MNWIKDRNWFKKIGFKIKKIIKKQPKNSEETDWKNCPKCQKSPTNPISLKTHIFVNVPTTLICLPN